MSATPLPIQRELSPEESDLVELLMALDQQHLFLGWAPAGEDEDAKTAMLAQLLHLDANYPGGLASYIERARGLLQISLTGASPLAAFVPAVPSGRSLAFGSDAFAAAEARGMQHVAGMCFVLVAGGLGERLGFSGIKVALPSETATGRTYMELYCRSILALQARANAARAAAGEPADVVLPLAIMVSGDTDAPTRALLEANADFGMAPGQIRLMRQEKVACLSDNDAHIALHPENAYAVLEKPHGHGDVHQLLHKDGIAAQWLAEGREYVIFFQDTNGLAFRTVPAAVGVSAELGLQVNSITVPRMPKEAVGAIALLEPADPASNVGSMTLNVEYNMLDPLLRASGSEDGDVAGDDGTHSPFPGNINQLVFALEPYVAKLEQTRGVLGEFVNPKYATADKTLFKSPTRLESMMQDYPKSLDGSAQVGFTSCEKWLAFSPVKNNVRDAASKNPPASAASGEADQFGVYAQMLRALGCDVAPAEPCTWSGVTVPMGPSVVLAPDVAVTAAELAARFPQPDCVRIAPRSLLVVDGDVTFNRLALNGALRVSAGPGVRVVVNRLEVANAGWQRVEAPADAPEVVAIRGYVWNAEEQREMKEVVIDEPGVWEVTGEEVVRVSD